MEVVLEVMGLQSDSSNWFIRDLPLFIAFAVLAAYTYSSGLRAPALIAFVKDSLIYIALTAFLLNLIVVVVLTPILRALKVPDGLLSQTQSPANTPLRCVCGTFSGFLEELQRQRIDVRNKY